jgi:hypothetical protein
VREEADKASVKINDVGKEMADSFGKGAASASALAKAEVSAFKDAEKAAKEAARAVKEQAETVASGIGAVGVAAGIMYAKLTESIAGYVRAGIAASAIGDQINWQMQQISLSIAGLFRPELEKLINMLRAVTDWFRSLSDAQRENLARWALFLTVGLGVAVMLPAVVIGLRAMSVAIQAISAAIAAGSLGTLPIIFAAVAAASVYFTEGLSGLWNVITPLADAVSAFAAVMGEILGPILQVVAIGITYVVKAVVALVEILKPVIQLVAVFSSGWLAWIAIVPAIVAGIWLVINAVRSLIVSLITMLALMGPKGWARIAAGLAVAGAGILAANAMQPGEEPKKGSRSAAPAKVGGPEDITSAFSRLNVAALNATAGIKAKSQEDLLQEIADNTGEKGPIVGAIGEKDVEYSTTRNDGGSF